MRKKTVCILSLVLVLFTMFCVSDAVFAQGGEYGSYYDNNIGANSVFEGPPVNFDLNKGLAAVISQMSHKPLAMMFLPFPASELDAVALVDCDLLKEEEIGNINEMMKNIREDGMLCRMLITGENMSPGSKVVTFGKNGNKSRAIFFMYPKQMVDNLDSILTPLEQKLFFSAECLRAVIVAVLEAEGESFNNAYNKASHVVLELLKGKAESGSGEAKAVAIVSLALSKGGVVSRIVSEQDEETPTYVKIDNLKLGADALSVAIADWYFLQEGRLVGLVGFKVKNKELLEEGLPEMSSEVRIVFSILRNEMETPVVWNEYGPFDFEKYAWD
ncbi:MAG: hypothetical protein KKF54_04310 [Candidatus Omnitrophica bacterium]|nr:hypothetical protein [Candidatus Omnitrophota bacterium]